MIFDTANELEAKRSESYYNLLRKKQAIIEIIEKRNRNLSEEEQRTLQQNKTIHMWFSVIANEIGYASKEDCKRDVKRTILGMKPCVNRFTGEIGSEDYRTSEMTISELAHFMDKMKAWADQELGIYLPMWSDPGYAELVKMYKNR